MLPFRPRRSLRPVRLRLPRRAVLWYLAAVALTVATALVVDGALSRAQAAEAAYGEAQSVVVVARPVKAGAVLGRDDLEVRPWPRALAPDDALSQPPTGRTALVALAPGEALVGSRVSGTDATGPAGRLGADERAVSVPVAVPGLPLEFGDSVDVLAGGAVGGGPDGDLPVGARAPDVVATGATVLGAEEETVVLAVQRGEAADVAAALTAGPLVLALRPPGP